MLKQSDIDKLLTDFLAYAEINLTWFNMNTILCLMPLLVLFILEPKFGAKLIEVEKHDEGLSYKWIVWLQLICHCV